MSESTPDPQLEIAHVLFIDIVGSSKLLTNEQSELLRGLNQIVRSTEQFRAAEAAGKLIRRPTGDGMALAFFSSRKRRCDVRWKLAKPYRIIPNFNYGWAFTAGRSM